MSKDQLSLFGAAVTAGVKPVEDPEARAIAARLPRWLHLGTSTWTFPGWAGIVYAGAPTQEALVEGGLHAYARHPLLGTVGIDRSYYEPLPAAVWREYAAQLPPGYRALSKVWNEITTAAFPEHPRWGDRAGQLNPAFLDPKLTLDRVITPLCEGFAAHAGPLVFELPPWPRPDPPRFTRALERLLAQLPSTLRYAFELRNPELLTPRYLDILHAHGASHAFNLWSGMPPVGEQMQQRGVLTSDVVVARLSLPPGARYEERRNAFAPFNRIVEIQRELRADIVRLACCCADRGAELYVVINNKVEGSAPLTVRALAEAIADELGGVNG